MTVSPKPFVTRWRATIDTEISPFCMAIGTPVFTQRLIMSLSACISSAVSFISPLTAKQYTIQEMAESACVSTVAHAAPAMPNLNTTTKSRSRRAFSKLAAPKNISGVFESPKALIMAFIQLYAATAIVPPQAICIYVTESPMSLSGTFKSSSIGFAAGTDKRLITTPNIAVTSAELNTADRRAFFLPAPKYCATIIPAPTERPMQRV